MLTGSALLSIAALDAMKRLDGPAKGMRFRTKEVKSIVRSSMSEAKCVEPAMRFSGLTPMSSNIGHVFDVYAFAF
jgi:hypothetical protein